MKHKVYKSMLGLGLSMLFSMPLFAQSGIKSQKTRVSPAVADMHPDLNFNFDLNIPDLKLQSIDGQLARLDHALEGLDMKIAPHIAGLEKQIALQLENIAPELDNINLNDHYQAAADETKNYTETSEKTKTLSKSYAVGAKDKLAINNQYGKVIINTWAKNEIKVDVEIKAFESSDSKAQELLDGVSIIESRQGDIISFKTDFDKDNIRWWSRTKNGNEEKRGVQINYVVYMPSRNPLDINNRYGSTTLSDFDGPVNINSSYGSFTAEKLGNPANRVKVSYGSANIESFSSGTLDVSYGTLKLTNADKLNADIRYSNAKIGKLTTGGNLDLSYGGCKIETLDKSVRNLVVNSSYSGLSMGIDDAASFNFDVTVSYAGFNFDDNKVNITSRTPDENAKGWNPTKNYKGTYGKGSDSRVIIKSNYGGVKFL